MHEWSTLIKKHEYITIWVEQMQNLPCHEENWIRVKVLTFGTVLICFGGWWHGGAYGLWDITALSITGINTEFHGQSRRLLWGV